MVNKDNRFLTISKVSCKNCSNYFKSESFTNHEILCYEKKENACKNQNK